MIDKVIVVLRDGSEISLTDWQKKYGLKPYSNAIGKYFSIREQRFEDDIETYGQLIVNELLIRVLDGFREAVDVPVNINSFNRDESRQEQLRSEGRRAAQYSPHVVKLAADIDTMDEHQTREWVKTLKQVASILGIKIRIGYKQYLDDGSTFIHVDVCPEYYAPGKPWNNRFHPIQWEKESEW
jgi:hypothetical protein